MFWVCRLITMHYFNINNKYPVMQNNLYVTYRGKNTSVNIVHCVRRFYNEIIVQKYTLYIKYSGINTECTSSSVPVLHYMYLLYTMYILYTVCIHNGNMVHFSHLSLYKNKVLQEWIIRDILSNSIYKLLLNSDFGST